MTKTRNKCVLAGLPLEGLSKFPEPEVPDDDVVRTFREIKVLRPGIFNALYGPIAVDVDDLRQMAANFNVDEPPGIFLDHMEHLAGQQIGRLRQVAMFGDELWALGEFIGQEARDKVLGGIWRKVSAGWWIEERSIFELSVVRRPAVEDAAIFQHQEEDEPMSGIAKNVKTEGEQVEEGAKAQETPKPEDAKATETPKAKETPKPVEPVAQAHDADTHPEVVKLRKEMDQMRAENAKQATLFAQLEAERREYRNVQVVSELIACGRITPAEEERELAYCAKLSAADLETYFEHRKEGPQVIHTGRLSYAAEGGKPVTKASAKEARTERVSGLKQLSRRVKTTEEAAKK